MRTASISFNYVLSHKMRFEGKHYLNDNALSCMSIEKNASKCFCLDDIADVFNPPVFKRQFCKQSGNSVMYFQSSDVSTANETSPVFINKKQVESLNLLVRKNDILITGFGTIGNVRLVSRLQDGVCYANNVCRVRIKNGVYLGYIYAFLSSKYAYAQLNNNASGSVVRYIEAPGVKKTLVPSFPESFQKEVDDLIQESARLREEAAEALEEAHGFIERNFIFANKKQISSVSIKSVLLSHNKRFEATYHTSENRSIYEYIISNCKYIRLGDLCDRIFRPGIFKREYVSKGVTFLGGADILMAIPDSDKRLSFRQVEKMPELKVKKNWILVTCGGTIGNTVIIDKQLEQCVISQHVMRIVPKEDILKGYLFAVLSSKIGNNLISLFTTGSVIPQIEAHHLELVPIPLFNKDIMERIDNKVSSYISKIEVAKENERKAIRMVEEEIEKWNK